MREFDPFITVVHDMVSPILNFEIRTHQGGVKNILDLGIQHTEFWVGETILGISY